MSILLKYCCLKTQLWNAAVLCVCTSQYSQHTQACTCAHIHANICTLTHIHFLNINVKVFKWKHFYYGRRFCTIKGIIYPEQFWGYYKHKGYRLYKAGVFERVGEREKGERRERDRKFKKGYWIYNMILQRRWKFLGRKKREWCGKTIKSNRDTSSPPVPVIEDNTIFIKAIKWRRWDRKSVV